MSVTLVLPSEKKSGIKWSWKKSNEKVDRKEGQWGDRNRQDGKSGNTAPSKATSLVCQSNALYYLTYS